MHKNSKYITLTSSRNSSKPKAARRRSKPLPAVVGPAMADTPQVQDVVEPEAVAASPSPFTVAYSRPGRVRMQGATAPDGAPWILATPTEQLAVAGGAADAQPAPGVWTRLQDWSDETSASAAKHCLREANIHLFEEDLKDAIKAARNVRDFPPLPLIDRVGWTEPHFALPSGEVASPEGSDPAVVLFKIKPVSSAKGTSAWLKGVERLAANQSIVTFVLAIPFAAPLLRLSPVEFNPGFELTGPPRKGKSTLQQLAASVIGVAIARHGQSYIIPANTTVNALEDQAVEHADLPLIIEDTSLFYADEAEASRQRKMLGLIMRLSSGTVKSRRDEAPQSPARFLYLTSSNEAFASMFSGGNSKTAAAAADRLLAIPVAESRTFGVFDKLPKGCDNSKQAIQAIVSLIKEHHGKPMRRFVRKLVAARAADEPALKRRIETLINEFRDAVGVDDNVGQESSIADVFGLMYAALTLAQDYGALPQGLKPLRAVIKVYGLNRAINGPPPSNLERLHLLAERSGVIRIDATNLQEISDDELAKAPALLRTDRHGNTLLVLTAQALRRAFSLPNRLFKDPDVQAIMRTDKDGRKMVTMSLRTNKKQERVYAFVLDAEPKDL